MKTQNENFATAIGTLAALATIVEIATTPKPGLVDLYGSSAHNDMDCALFIASASALAPYWREQVMEGIRFSGRACHRELFARLKSRGVEMESAMLEATGGVNTHKGLIFALSLMTG
ncbi:MAG: triphosphoribosyl-dephospho-CoA synthase, partial [Synergistaceae bacterium]|nr:triphosphoribosyl-dephospho-CoA synthase [Synergistaceae bacterium]